MQVFGLPGHLIRNAGRASRLLGAETSTIEAERRRDAVARWRRAMDAGLSADDAAAAVGVPRSTPSTAGRRSRSRRAGVRTDGAPKAGDLRCAVRSSG